MYIEAWRVTSARGKVIGPSDKPGPPRVRGQGDWQANPQQCEMYLNMSRYMSDTGGWRDGKQ